MFDRSAIAKEAHRIARRYAGATVRGEVVTYRRALSWGFRDAWRDAKNRAAFAAFEATRTDAERARRDQIIAIHCSTDGRLTAADHDRLAGLPQAA